MHRKEGLAVTSVIGVVERRQTMPALANVLGQQKLAAIGMTLRQIRLL